MNNLKFKQGDLVYFVETRGQKAEIKYGIISSYVEKEKTYLVDFYQLKDDRVIDGIPICEFKTTEWRKLPKGYKINDRLFTWSSSFTQEEVRFLNKCKINNPDDLKEAIKKGLLIQKHELERIEIDLNRNKEYRIVKQFPAWTLTYGEDKRTFTSLSEDCVYCNYEEAREKKEIIEKEWERVRSLSDLEWSLEEIEKTLKYLPTKVQDKYRQVIKSMDNLADLEVKRVGGKLQYRYFRSGKSWADFELYEKTA